VLRFRNEKIRFTAESATVIEMQPGRYLPRPAPASAASLPKTEDFSSGESPASEQRQAN
jgi:hypothetical protein